MTTDSIILTPDGTEILLLPISRGNRDVARVPHYERAVGGAQMHSRQAVIGAGAVVVYSDFTPPQDLVDVVLGGINRADSASLHNIGLVVIPGLLGAQAVIWRNPLALGDAVCERLGTSLEEALTRVESPPVDAEPRA